MAKPKIDPELFAKIKKKLGVGTAQAYKIIVKEANRLKRPGRIAALNLASDNGINISKYATAEDYVILGTLAGSAPQPVAVAQPLSVSKGRSKAPAKTKKAAQIGRRVFVIHGRERMGP